MALTVSFKLAGGDENVDPYMPFVGVPVSRSPLPSWHPRLPLQDITNVLQMLKDLRKDNVSKRPKKRPHPISSFLVQGNGNRQAAEGRQIQIQQLRTSRTAEVLRKGFRHTTFISREETHSSKISATHKASNRRGQQFQKALACTCLQVMQPDIKAAT